MNLLYIIYTLVADIRPHNPTGHPALPPPISDSNKESNSQNIDLIDVNFQTKFMGIDARFPVGVYDPDEFIRIAKLNDYFEKLKKVEQKVKNNDFIEDVKKDELINDILRTDEIDRFKIKSGGLFDDWERNL